MYIKLHKYPKMQKQTLVNIEIYANTKYLDIKKWRENDTDKKFKNTYRYKLNNSMQLQFIYPGYSTHST